MRFSRHHTAESRQLGKFGPQNYGSGGGGGGLDPHLIPAGHLSRRLTRRGISAVKTTFTTAPLPPSPQNKKSRTAQHIWDDYSTFEYCPEYCLLGHPGWMREGHMISTTSHQSRDPKRWGRQSWGGPQEKIQTTQLVRGIKLVTHGCVLLWDGACHDGLKVSCWRTLPIMYSLKKPGFLLVIVASIYLITQKTVSIWRIRNLHLPYLSLFIEQAPGDLLLWGNKCSLCSPLHPSIWT